MEIMVERRKQLIDLANTRELSGAEMEELKTILQKELVHDFAAGKIEVLGFILLLWLTQNLPPLNKKGFDIEL